jgi:hypothetical protein
MASDFALDVKKLLEQYSDDVFEAMAEVVPEVAKESAKKLKQESPKGKSGKYAKGWTSKADKGRMTTTATVYGKTGTYQLAHLLEHGHATRKGGRTKPIVHIKPVEEWATEEVISRTAGRIEKI